MRSFFSRYMIAVLIMKKLNHTYEHNYKKLHSCNNLGITFEATCLHVLLAIGI